MKVRQVCSWLTPYIAGDTPPLGQMQGNKTVANSAIKIKAKYLL